MLDACLGFTTVRGVIITLAFAGSEELDRCAKIILPDEPNLSRKAKTMASETIGMNFQFQ
jgi:hypothetical protein